MCGIVGFTGKTPAAGVLLDGLKRLEYRGYDSAGLALGGGDGLLCLRAVGKVRNLEALVKGSAEAGKPCCGIRGHQSSHDLPARNLSRSVI